MAEVSVLGHRDTQHVRKSGAARSHPGPGLWIYFSRRHERVVQFAIAPRISAWSSSPLLLKMSQELVMFWLLQPLNRLISKLWSQEDTQPGYMESEWNFSIHVKKVNSFRVKTCMYSSYEQFFVSRIGKSNVFWLIMARTKQLEGGRMFLQCGIPPALAHGLQRTAKC